MDVVVLCSNNTVFHIVNIYSKAHEQAILEKEQMNKLIMKFHVFMDHSPWGNTKN